MDEGKILGIIVHYSDCLNLDVNVVHPSVKVLVVNLDQEGSLLQKKEKGKSVTSLGDSNIKTIQPSLTQPFVFKSSKTLVPRWEELILFNESFSFIQSLGTKVGLFFLIQDFVSMNKVNNQSEARGWTDVAWAFLQPFPHPDYSNTERRVRLQLFKPNHRPKTEEQESKILWEWWTKFKHNKYPSTLYVTVQAVDPPSSSSRSPTTDGKTLTTTRRSFEGDDDDAKHLLSALEASKLTLWSRGPGQSCHIPKIRVGQLDCGGKGTSFLQFSRDGRFLAMACPTALGSAIFIFDASSWKRVVTLEGHRGPIYDMDWFDHKTLLTASGDGTAQVFHLGGGREVLEHPSFVYAARFHSNFVDIVVTGSYDKVIRIWSRRNEDNNVFIVHQELVEHEGYLTSLVFDSDGQNLYSGDSQGRIKVWEVIGNTHKVDLNSSMGRSKNMFFRLRKNLNLSEVMGSNIEALKLHPGGRRLLVHSNSSMSNLVMIDLTRPSPVVMQEYKTGLLQGSKKRRCASTITPCGSFVLCGTSDGLVFCWDTDSGSESYVYQDPIDTETEVVIGAMSFHPLEHMLVFGALGSGVPTSIFKHVKAE